MTRQADLPLTLGQQLSDIIKGLTYPDMPSLTGREVPLLLDDDELEQMAKDQGYPLLGVFYEGCKPQMTAETSGGRASDCLFSVILLIERRSIQPNADRINAIKVFNEIRNAVVQPGNRRSASNHFWRFNGEIMGLKSDNGVILSLQRWIVAVPF